MDGVKGEKQMTAAAVERDVLIDAIWTLPDPAIEKLASYASFLESEYLNDNDDGFYSATNMKRLKHSIEQMKNGQFVTKTFEEFEQMVDE